MKKIILVGASGLLVDFCDELESQGWTIEGYIDKQKNKNSDLIYLGNDQDNIKGNKLITMTGLKSYSELLIKNKLFQLYKQDIENLIFKGAKISKSIEIIDKSNIIIFDLVSIKNSAIIGENTFINTMTSIGHHTHIKGNTSISIGVLIGGNVTIGNACFIGMGAKIFPGVSIGENCCISANAIITQNVPDNSYVSGKNKIKPMKIEGMGL